MKEVLIGDLRHRLVVETPTSQGDEGGGRDTIWVEVSQIWGQITAVGGREQLRNDQTLSQVTHEIIIRFRDDLTPRMRLRHLSEVFLIKTIEDKTGRRRFLTLTCLLEDKR